MQATIQSSDYTHVLHVDVYPLKINWPLLIKDISLKGIPPQRQADMLGKNYSTFQRWMNGSDPLFQHGHSLLVLHQKICGPEVTEQRFHEMDIGE